MGSRNALLIILESSDQGLSRVSYSYFQEPRIWVYYSFMAIPKMLLHPRSTVNCPIRILNEGQLKYKACNVDSGNNTGYVVNMWVFRPLSALGSMRCYSQIYLFFSDHYREISNIHVSKYYNQLVKYDTKRQFQSIKNVKLRFLMSINLFDFKNRIVYKR